MQIETIVESSIIKIVGVFTYENSNIEQFINDGFFKMPISEFEFDSNLETQNAVNLMSAKRTTDFYRDTYYKEFWEMMFGETRNSVKSFLRNKCLNLVIDKKPNVHYNFQSNRQELFLFPNLIGIFSLSFELNNVTLGYISDLTHNLKHFNAIIDDSIELHSWISKNLLSGIALRGEDIKSDEYSGSKFKTYSIINFDEPTIKNENVDNLLFELGTSSKIGSLVKKENNAHTMNYFELIMKNKIDVFNNYSGIALIDSFTVIGNNLFNSKFQNDNEFNKWNTWNRVYFSIYIYNLFIRYNIFRFNAEFTEDELKTRDEFQQFIGNHNVKVISFNFLPNIINDTIKKAFDISEEIDFFEKRLNRLANIIQEEQEKRQAFFLGIISVLSSVSAFEPVFHLITNTQVNSGLSPLYFYLLLSIIVIISAYFVISYMFARQLKKIKTFLKNKIVPK